MNKRLITLGIVLIAGAVVVTMPDIANSLLAFVFLGIIPGTDISLPFWAMGLFIIFTAAVAIMWLSSQSLYIGDRAHMQKEAKAAARSYVLKKTAKTTAPKTKRVTKPAKQTKRGYRVATSSS